MNTSKLFQNLRGDHVIIGCACGAGCECGQLHLRPDAVADEPQLLASVWFVPSRCLRARVGQAWDLLLGRAISTDLLWDRATARDAAHWLLRFASVQRNDSRPPRRGWSARV